MSSNSDPPPLPAGGLPDPSATPGVTPDFNPNDFEIKAMGNIGADFFGDETTEEAAKRQADYDAGNEARRKRCYKEDGSLDGPFSEKTPPPGMAFVGYKKGCTGIVWKPADQAGEQWWGTSGYCARCGYSLFHYAGEMCNVQKEKHPEWVDEEGSRKEDPPAFSDVNG